MDKLGIYIPTYNRPDELGECLNSFIPQLRPFGFPIYISDNSTDDKTEKMVMKIKKRYPRIYYRKNAYMKYGRIYATNLKSVLEMGNTEFVWFFSDDDAIKKNAISTIVNNLFGVEFLMVNWDGWSKDLKKKISTPRKEYEDTGIDYHSALTFINGQNYKTHMAHAILKKNILIREIKNLKIRSCGLDFLHTILFYRGISDFRCNGKFISKPIFKYRIENIEYSNRILDIFFRSWDITHDMLEGYYSNLAIKKSRKRDIRTLILLLIMDKNRNNERKLEEYLIYTYLLKINLFYKLVLLCCDFIPKFVVRYSAGLRHTI